jgi:hypothetical protein
VKKVNPPKTSCRPQKPRIFARFGVNEQEGGTETYSEIIQSPYNKGLIDKIPFLFKQIVLALKGVFDAFRSAKADQSLLLRAVGGADKHVYNSL